MFGNVSLKLKPRISGIQTGFRSLLERHWTTRGLKYNLKIVTGKRRGAGTTAQVHVQLVGSRAKSDRFHLNGVFERSSTVNEEIEVNEDIGDLDGLIIGHDNVGDQGVGWYLSHVTVRIDSEKDRNEHHFPVHRWLGRSDFGYAEELPCTVLVSEGNLRENLLESDSEMLGSSLVSFEVSPMAYPHPSKVQAGQKGVVQSRLGHAGEDAYSVTPLLSNEKQVTMENSNLVVCALADGVYAWTDKGIDAGKLSRSLVRLIQLKAQQIILSGSDASEKKEKDSHLPDPAILLEYATNQIIKREIEGSSTACVCCFDGVRGQLEVLNIGDSGVCVVRQGVVIFKSQEQEHSFGFPFQLPIDAVDTALQYKIRLFSGDVVVIGSDGIFDNLHEHEIEDIVREAVRFSPSDRSTISIDEVRMVRSERARARSLATSIFDREKQTPYSSAASEEFNMIYHGGKRDDICCIAILVNAAV